MEEVIFARASDGWPNGDKIVYDTDTCRNWNDIVFTCTQKADSIWWIFDDTEMRPEWQQKQSFSIKFGAPGGPMQTQPERVKITCIVKNNKPNPCIPNDNGMDTFTRYMVYMPWWQMGFMGTFRGSLSHKPDSIFLLEIRMDTIDNGPLTHPTYFVRFDNLLTVPPLVPTDDFRPEGFEYSWNPNFGFSVAYLEFFAADPEIAQKYNSNYKGVSHRGKAIFDSRKQELKIDFIRGGYGMSTMREWPPKDQTLYTFTGIKL
ncbi:MAG: hypothetical protein ACK5XN_11615 [Bacteroidota bacterium]